MFGIENLALFIASSWLLILLPGPDSLLVVGRAAGQGARAGLAASLGIGAGTLVHITGAALGLSAILATSATAFMAVKILGCLYLLYIGLSLLFSRSAPSAAAQPPVAALPLRKIFLQGLLTNLLNPKVALFFLAFVPQFIGGHSDSPALAFIVLGLLFNANGMLWLALLSWSAARVSRRLKQSTRLTSWLSRGAGVLFGYFGVKLLVSGQG